uniref:Uncharacterized protein n=1 Tax=Streptomyces sp. NBC_00008 TaxID=2903610 RepID=A0AAU2W238_9ACTN
MINAEVAVSHVSASRQRPFRGGAVESDRAGGVFVRYGAAL